VCDPCRFVPFSLVSLEESERLHDSRFERHLSRHDRPLHRMRLLPSREPWRLPLAVLLAPVEPSRVLLGMPLPDGGALPEGHGGPRAE